MAYRSASRPAIVARVVVDVLSNQRQDRIPHSRPGIDVLQSPKNRNDFIATFEIEFHIEYAVGIEPPLLRKRFSHPFAP